MSGSSGRQRSRALRLRRWVLASACTFALLLAGLIGYGRYRVRHALLRLPHQLGINVKSETDGFTYSQTVKGRTLFTIHAAKAIQHQDNKTTLHNVSVTLYGAPGTNRTDTVRGAEFEYDQANGIVRAMGETLIDVAAPDAATGTPRSPEKRITIRGKGFVFLQKLGVASTAEPIQFQYGGSQGEAVGADYEMDTGILTLQHDVHLHSNERGHTERIDAAAAQLDRNTRMATLHDAVITDAGNILRAPYMVAALRPSADEHAGSLQHVHASGGVAITTTSGPRVQAPELDADLTTGNRLDGVKMRGGVRLQDGDTQAAAQQAMLRFRNGQADHLWLNGQASVTQASAAQQSQTLGASQIDAALTGTGDHLALGELHATGAAQLTLVQPPIHAGPAQRTVLTAPTLVAHAFPAVRTVQIQSLDASGGAHLLQDDGAGGVRTSTSEHLTATFTPADIADQRNALQSVLQQGHVVLQESRPAAAAASGHPARAASHLQAAADSASYQSASDELVLTGTPRIAGDGLQLAADRIVMRRATGDAEATGDVRGSFTQATQGPAKAGTAEPAQFAASSAQFARGIGTVVLHGSQADARLWTRGGQIEAPVIQADQRANTLHAYAVSGTASTGAVKTVLVQVPPTRPKTTDDGPATAPPHTSAGATRIFSREVVYHGGTPGSPGSAQFLGGVRLLQGSDVLTADTAAATLQSGAMLEGGVRAITADGHVRLQQGARVATGTHLVYTAADRRAVLTGIPGAQPVVNDPAQGTITGRQLTLLLGTVKGDNQVEVTGSRDAPVRTELDVPEKNAATPGSRSRTGRKSRLNP